MLNHDYCVESTSPKAPPSAADEIRACARQVNDRLVHAQEIVLTLRDTLKSDIWDGAPQLLALYDHLHGELVGANLGKDRARAAAAANLLGQIGQAWRDATIKNQLPGEPTSEMG